MGALSAAAGKLVYASASADAAHDAPGAAAFRAFAPVGQFAAAGAAIADIFGRTGCAGLGFVAGIQFGIRKIIHVVLAW